MATVNETPDTSWQSADPEPPRAASRPVEGTTTAERRAWGRALRGAVPRSAHATWSPAPDRPDPVALLVAQGATRVPELLPIRYGRMLVSPFAFFRGSALVMAADLARLPSSGITVQCCGDAHLSNFGVFATPERRLLFDLNDFDETHPAPFEWDLKRLAASFVVAARASGLPPASGREAVATVARTYRRRMQEFADMRFLDLWYSSIDTESWLSRLGKRGDRERLKRAHAFIAKAGRKTNVGSLGRLAERVGDGWRIREEPPLVVRRNLTPELAETLSDVYAQYRETVRSDVANLLDHYRYQDIARKVVGVGSVGTLAFVVLLVGNHPADPLFLQLKEAPPSVLARYTTPGSVEHEGERVVRGQRLMQAASDMLLGWMRTDIEDRPYDFYVRQLRDWKGSFAMEDMDTEGLRNYARACGHTLARAHARSGSSSAIAGYLGNGDTFDKAVAEFAEAYADQTELDFQALAAAEADGRIAVERGL